MFSWRHVSQRARSGRALQAVCAVLLAAGCARVPPPRGEAEVRATLLQWNDGKDVASRAEGVLSLTRRGRKLGSAEVRWVSVADSVAIVGSVGPVRALAGSLRGDSLLLDLYRSDVAIAGTLTGAGVEEPGLLRFLLEPWRFNARAIRAPLERARVEPTAE